MTLYICHKDHSYPEAYSVSTFFILIIVCTCCFSFQSIFEAHNLFFYLCGHAHWSKIICLLNPTHQMFFQQGHKWLSWYRKMTARRIAVHWRQIPWTVVDTVLEVWVMLRLDFDSLHLLVNALTIATDIFFIIANSVGPHNKGQSLVWIFYGAACI